MLEWMMGLRSCVCEYNRANKPAEYTTDKPGRALEKQVVSDMTEKKCKTWEQYLQRVVQVCTAERKSHATCLPH